MTGSLGKNRQFSREFIDAFKKAFPERTDDHAKLEDGFDKEFVLEHLMHLFQSIRQEQILPDHVRQMIDDGRVDELRAEADAMAERKALQVMWSERKVFAEAA